MACNNAIGFNTMFWSGTIKHKLPVLIAASCVPSAARAADPAVRALTAFGPVRWPF
jgi:hypothetical protein